MIIQNFKTTNVPILGLPFGSSRKMCPLDATNTEIHRIYYREGSGASSQRLQAGVKLVLEIVLTKYATPFTFNLH